MLQAVFAPLVGLGPLLLRVALGIIFLVHGWPKMNPNSPMKGPAGFSGALRQLGVPMPALFAWVVILLETLGALLLIVGLGTRILGLLFAVDMLVAIWAKRRAWNVPFMAQQTTGWEFDFALLVAALSLVFTGGGAAALDQAVGL
ncbi:MAG: DoxX family protein [Armatimonadota bacterium]|nr:DoxX family protein [Armatimonadota bacterium]MDR7426117.1 DoxX family protein [Armatimonadota bacterium]MDR7463527.1 DoxX family protein [Armatimonadota bacterium]MDR7469116.1 DoxX family protein [Armatimonadota bacterium]MDR7475356.1 DoxX family protein [Armatimonadota bacterium]